MEAPEWYGEWLHDSVHALQARNSRLQEEFRLGAWERFDYDLASGTLTFSENGIVKVIAEIQIAGTTSAKAGNWLWAWANSHWPDPLVTDSELVREFGEEHGICELSHDYVDEESDLNARGWELTAAMVRITDALGAYRPPREEGGGLFLVYKSGAGRADGRAVEVEAIRRTRLRR
jgi:hypothetical protein